MSPGESPSAVTGLKSQALGNTWGDAALGEATCKAVAIQGLFCCLQSFFTGDITVLEFHICSKQTFLFPLYKRCLSLTLEGKEWRHLFSIQM